MRKVLVMRRGNVGAFYVRCGKGELHVDGGIRRSFRRLLITIGTSFYDRRKGTKRTTRKH